MKPTGGDREAGHDHREYVESDKSTHNQAHFLHRESDQNLDDEETPRDEGVEQNEEPVFLPPSPPREYRVLLGRGDEPVQSETLPGIRRCVLRDPWRQRAY